MFIPEQGDERKPAQTAEPQIEETPAEETQSESTDYKDAVPEDIREQEEVVVEKPVKIGGKLFVVIDDVGNNISDLEYFLDVPVDITFAVMPERTYSIESAKMIRKAGFEFILHQPMEPEGQYDPGVGAIYTSMSKDQIVKILDENLREFPDIRGINNHMGSKATADRKVMTAVLSYIKRHEMFFLDSVTTHKSIAQEVATDLGVPFAKRNVVFLDNDSDKDAIQKAFTTGTEMAAAKGSAVMIGHLKSHALVEIIKEMAPDLSKNGYTFHGISDLFEGSATQ